MTREEMEQLVTQLREESAQLEAASSDNFQGPLSVIGSLSRAADEIERMWHELEAESATVDRYHNLG